MKSHTALPEAPDHLLEQLRARALDAIARLSGLDELITYIDAGREADNTVRRELQDLHIVTTVPDELIDALRAPRGVQRLVRLQVHNRAVRVMINPIGYPDPDHERAVWKQIHDLALQEVAA